MQRRPRERRGMNETDVPTKQQATKKKARVLGPHEQSGRTTGYQAAESKGAQEPQCDDSAEAAGALRPRGPNRPGSQRFSAPSQAAQTTRISNPPTRGKAAYDAALRRDHAQEREPAFTPWTHYESQGWRGDNRNRVRRLVREFFRGNHAALVPPARCVDHCSTGCGPIEISRCRQRAFLTAGPRRRRRVSRLAARRGSSSA